MVESADRWSTEEAIMRLRERAAKMDNANQVFHYINIARQGLASGKCPKYITAKDFSSALDVLEHDAILAHAQEVELAAGDAQAEMLQVLGWKPYH